MSSDRVSEFSAEERGDGGNTQEGGRSRGESAGGEGDEGRARQARAEQAQEGRRGAWITTGGHAAAKKNPLRRWPA